MEPSLTKVNVVGSSRMLAVIEGGNSLMIHSTNADGIDEPDKNNVNIINSNNMIMNPCR